MKYRFLNEINSKNNTKMIISLSENVIFVIFTVSQIWILAMIGFNSMGNEQILMTDVRNCVTDINVPQ